MAYPSPKVYIAFNGLPYDVSPTFVDVTSYVRAINTHRGRTDDFTQFDIGTATVVLDNRTRLFDPFYTSGTYYGKLTPRLQIKITATSAAVEYDVFRGFVSGWPVTWSEAGKDSTVTLQCFDALGLMANEQVPNDWSDYYTRSLAPLRFYRGNDSRTTGTIRDQIYDNLSLSTVSTNPTFFEQPSLAANIPGTSATVISYAATGTAQASPDRLSFACFMRAVTPNTTDDVYFNYDNGTSGIFIQIFQNGQYYIETKFSGGSRQGGGYIGFAPSSQNFHMAVSGNTATNVTLYINGQGITNDTNSSAARTGSNPEKAEVGFANFQDWSIYNLTLTSAQVNLLYNAGTGRFSETSSARLTRLVGTTSFSSSLCSFTASPVATVSEIGSGTGVVPEMQLVADSEGGNLYVSKSGVLTLTARRAVFTDTRSANVQATIQDTGSALKYGTEVEISYDADNLKNDVTINFTGDGQVSQTNTTTIAAFGASSTLIETQLNSPTSANDLATYELGTQGALVPRIQPIDLSPNTADADWTTILGLELLDRVTFIRTPSVGNSFSRAALINAIDHTFIPGQTQTQISLSMRYTSPLILDDSVRGKYDFNYYG
jgi:hypothetical protein